MPEGTPAAGYGEPIKPPLDAIGEFKHAVWRIVTYTSSDLGDEGTCGYLLSEAQVEEIAAEAHEYARGMAADEREQIAQLAEERGAIYPSTAARLSGYHKSFADLIRQESTNGN